MSAPGDEHPKHTLHEHVQDALQHPEIGGPALGDAVVTRWVLIAEVAMTDSRMGMATVTSTPSGSDLRSWEQIGLIGHALRRVLRGND